jgi:succinate-semialdehyde dehydrogenase/glutarate-semialdehyde dehydrogenase
MKLKNSALLRSDAYIDGVWIKSDSKKTFIVNNPATGEKITDVADCGAAETKRAIEAADKAQPAWRKLTGKERGAVMRKWFDLMMQNQEDLAVLMTSEQGKPLAESRGEIAYGASFIEWFAEEAKRVYGDTIPQTKPGTRIMVVKQPVGVVAAITPWNFPIAMITRKCAPAIAAGCTVVLKPAQQTPLSALALMVLAEQAGIPKGVLNIVTGSNAREIGKELTTNPLVRKVGFTGSTEVGKILMQQSSSTVKRVSLELGGNAPFIVFDDADIDQAVTGAMASKFRNMGQTCVCANRFLVQEKVYDAFAEKLSKAMQNLKVGNGLEDGVNQGPLIDEHAVKKVEELMEDAKQKGAKITIGGKPHKLGRTYYEPTLIKEAHTQMRLAREEIFGPVAALFRFNAEEDAIKIANDTEFGLAAYFYARDMGRVFRVVEALDYGIVGVNEGIISNEVAPFGGIKQSGFGREGSHYGIDEFVDVKYVLLGGIGT